MQSLLTEHDAAARLGISSKTLSNWRWQGFGPPFCRIGRLVRYRPEKLEAWADQQARASTSDGGGVQ